MKRSESTPTREGIAQIKTFGLYAISSCAIVTLVMGVSNALLF